MPKIHSLRKNEVEIESETSSFQAERSRTPELNSITVEPKFFCRPPMVKRFFNPALQSWVPVSLHPSLVSEVKSSEVEAGPEIKSAEPVDIRPHIYDPVMKKYILCDSGSQVGAFPPDPGDKLMPELFLKAANGTKIACYGYKNVDIKIGRKNYPFRIIKAQVESPIIGWDFMKKHKLELRWDDDEDITIYDKVADISSKLHFKPVPTNKSSQLRNLALIQSARHLDQEGSCNPEELIAEVAAVKALGDDEVSEHDEDINVVPEGPFKTLLAKFPGLLKQNFNAEPTKTDVIHRIHTNGPPIKSKVRKLLPGSPKA